MLSWQIYRKYDRENEGIQGKGPAARAEPQDLSDIRRILNQASQIATAMPDNILYENEDGEKLSHKVLTLQAIGIAQANAGDVRGALQTAAALPDGYFRTQLLAVIAQAQAITGDVRGGLQTAARLPDDFDWVFVEIAIAQARAGDLAGALRTAGPFRRGISRVWAAIADDRRKAGDVPGALQAANNIPELLLRMRILEDIAAAQARAGDRAGRAQTLRQVVQTARAIREDFLASTALTTIAVAQTRMGEVADALRTAAAIRADDGGRRAYALAEIARARAEEGDIPGALQTAAGLTGDVKVEALHWIGAVQAKAGDREGARRTLRQAFENLAPLSTYHKDYSLKAIARTQTEAGSIAEALETAAAIEGVTTKIDALGEIAAAQVHSGDRVGAVETVGKALQIARTLVDGDVGLNIAVAQARIGDMTAARQTAATISDAPQRAQAVRDIAAEQAKAGDARGALAWATKEKEPYLKAGALLGVAEGLLSKLKAQD